ncbi:LuxR C-terminal-related transcriptional regulator [Paenibacillus sp. BR2-3]|uniref:helix-turn-helix domain-containing protein n=1 Tax=Paenibacillus sp. BR2-3 TaxID=3048494 RepID=UPI0039779566
MSIFQKCQLFADRSWKTVSDMPRETFEFWKDQSNNGAKKVTDHSNFIQTTKEVLKGFAPDIPLAHLFLLTDQQGDILYLQGSREILIRLEAVGINVNASLSAANAGINAISLAMYLNDMVVVEGHEHTLEIFREWTCLCVPIPLPDNEVGYLDLSFQKGVHIQFAIPLLKHISWLIQSKMTYEQHTDQLQKLEMFNLSKRELEVAQYWLYNKSVLHISHVLGIAEGTVRNTLKKVYRKTGVHK